MLRIRFEKRAVESLTLLMFIAGEQQVEAQCEEEQDKFSCRDPDGWHSLENTLSRAHQNFERSEQDEAGYTKGTDRFVLVMAAGYSPLSFRARSRGLQA